MIDFFYVIHWLAKSQMMFLVPKLLNLNPYPYLKCNVRAITLPSLRYRKRDLATESEENFIITYVPVRRVDYQT